MRWAFSFGKSCKKEASLVKRTLKITTKAEASKAITKINIAFQEMQHHHTKMNVMIQRLQLHIKHSNTQNISLYSFSPIDRSYKAKNFSDFVKYKLLS